MTFATLHGLPRKLRLIAGIGAVSCIALNASAATTEGLFAARGTGAQACETLGEAGDTGREGNLAALSVWIAGYVSHANRATPDRFDVSPIVDNQVLASIVAQFCSQNPTALIENVVASVLQMTANGGQSTESDLIELRNEQAVTTLRAGTLIEVQQALVAEGFLAQGDVDGAYGPTTRDALSTFQEQRSLTATGLPDPLTMLNLFSAR